MPFQIYKLIICRDSQDRFWLAHVLREGPKTLYIRWLERVDELRYIPAPYSFLQKIRKRKLSNVTYISVSSHAQRGVPSKSRAVNQKLKFPLRYEYGINIFNSSSIVFHLFILFHFISIRFDSIRFDSIRFVSFRFVSFRFVSFRFVSFRFVSFRFVSFRFVSFFEFLFCFILFYFILFLFLSSLLLSLTTFYTPMRSRKGR